MVSQPIVTGDYPVALADGPVERYIGFMTIAYLYIHGRHKSQAASGRRAVADEARRAAKGGTS